MESLLGGWVGSIAVGDRLGCARRSAARVPLTLVHVLPAEVEPWIDKLGR